MTVRAATRSNEEQREATRSNATPSRHVTRRVLCRQLSPHLIPCHMTQTRLRHESDMTDSLSGEQRAAGRPTGMRAPRCAVAPPSAAPVARRTQRGKKRGNTVRRDIDRPAARPNVHQPRTRTRAEPVVVVVERTERTERTEKTERTDNGQSDPWRCHGGVCGEEGPSESSLPNSIDLRAPSQSSLHLRCPSQMSISDLHLRCPSQMSISDVHQRESRRQLNRRDRHPPHATQSRGAAP